MSSKRYPASDLVFAVFISTMATIIILSIIFGFQIDNHNERWVNWNDCIESGAEASFCNDAFKVPEGAR